MLTDAWLSGDGNRYSEIKELTHGIFIDFVARVVYPYVIGANPDLRSLQALDTNIKGVATWANPVILLHTFTHLRHRLPAFDASLLPPPPCSCAKTLHAAGRQAQFVHTHLSSLLTVMAEQGPDPTSC